MDNIIEVRELKKKYGNHEAVKGISFNVERGCLLAYLGPNGAGKSTSIDILCTLLKSNGGDITIDGFKVGKDDGEIRKIIGIAFQNNLLDNRLTVRENLISRGKMYGISSKELVNRINKIAKVTGVIGFIDRKYGKLSGGQRRRADLARALINEPKILFLDEPTTGLDPATRQAIWQTIRDMQNERNMTVFLTTHYMEEAANADKIVIINHGEIVEDGTPTQLKDKYTKDHVILYGDLSKIEEEVKKDNYEYEIMNDRLSIVSKSKEDAFEIIGKYINLVDNYEVIKGDMDDVFLNIVGKENEIND